MYKRVFLSIIAAVMVLSTIFIMLPVIASASTEVYSPDKITLSQGQLVSGGYSNLSSADGSYLVINSALSAGYYQIDWYAQFTLPGRQVTNMTLSYTGKYSTWRGQSLFLYNFATSTWARIDYRTMSASPTSFTVSISNPANYVSPNGQVWVRSYSYATAGFTSYTDYLKLAATISDVTPVPAPAPAPIPNPAPLLNPASGDYLPNTAIVTQGQLVSGSYSNLGSADGSYLVINSAVSAGYYQIDWYAQFTLPGRQVTNMTLIYTGKYSTWRGQSLFAYNFTTSSWDRIDYRTMTASQTSFTLSISSPANYVSANGQVWIRPYAYATAGFTSYTDYLKLGVKY